MRYARLSFSNAEKVDLCKAWLATSAAFAVFFIVSGNDTPGAGGFLTALLFAGLTAGVGFVGHELMHKAASHHFGVHAEFRSDDRMLVVSIIIAFFGLIIAAPGAVLIGGHITRRENGIISAAGPAANITLACLFGLLTLAPGLLGAVGTMGMLINAMLAAFNLIPLGNFDGAKVFQWHKGIWAVLLCLGAALVVMAW